MHNDTKYSCIKSNSLVIYRGKTNCSLLLMSVYLPYLFKTNLKVNFFFYEKGYLFLKYIFPRGVNSYIYSF